jgi:hypothetical protein
MAIQCDRTFGHLNTAALLLTPITIRPVMQLTTGPEAFSDAICCAANGADAVTLSHISRATPTLRVEIELRAKV